MPTNQYEFLSRCAQRIWRATTFAKMIQTCVTIGRESFGVVAAQHYSIKSVERGFELTAVPAEMDLPIFAESTSDALRELLKKLPLKSQELRAGFSTLVADGRQVEFATFGDPAAEWSLLAWERDLSHFSGTDSDAMWEFLVAQVQTGSIWCNRLDKTQALLYRDDLTGLFNHRYLDVALSTEIRRGQRFQSVFSLLFIDLDNFKPINDSYGHLSGSGVLRQVADLLRDELREVDSVARYGGDEFVVLLLGASTSDSARVAERIRKVIAEHPFKAEAGEVVRITCSIGLAAYPQHGSDKETLIRKADESMYVSKRSGKNRVSIAEKPAAEFDAGDSDGRLKVQTS